MSECVECGKQTSNPKFCSRSCSATWTNRIKSRKHPDKFCGCGKLIWHSMRRCDECHEIHMKNKPPAKKRNPTPKKQKIRKDRTKCTYCESILTDENAYKQSSGQFHPYCKSCHNEYTKLIQRKFKADCIEYKGGKCVHCGFDLNNASLHFHHEDPSQKVVELSKYRSQKFDDRIKPELDKCILLCTNCHFSLHSPKSRNRELDAINSLADLIGFNTFKECQTSDHKKKRKYIKLLNGRCKKCGYNKMYCSLQFHHLFDKKFLIRERNRTEDEILEELKKCELLCGNCHEMTHTKVKNNPNSLSHIKSLANLISAAVTS